MSLAILFTAAIFALSMGFLSAAAGRVISEFLIGFLGRPKPLRPLAAVPLRLLFWLAGYGIGGWAAWQRFWAGFYYDGSQVHLPGVPDGWVWMAAFILGLVLLWLASWMARSRMEQHPKA